MKICLKPKSGDLMVIDSFIHVIILLTILFLFFIFLISKLEKQSLTNEINDQINDNWPTFYKTINDNTDGAFLGMVQAMNTPPAGAKSPLQAMSDYYDQPDAATVNWNRTPVVGTIIVILALVAGFLGIWATLRVSCNKCVPVGQIIIENIVVFLLIGGIESVFFYKIAMNYIPIMPSYLIDETLQNLQKRF